MSAPCMRGEGSAIPQRKRQVKPAKKLNPHQSLMLVARNGGWAPADRASERLARDRGLMHDGVEAVAYLYSPRDGKQWRKVHALCTLVGQHVEEFGGMDSHSVLKKLQLDSGIACDSEEIDLGTLGKVTRRIPQSFAFGFMDQSSFEQAYRELSVYVAGKYFGLIGAEAEGEMAKLLAREPQG